MKVVTVSDSHSRHEGIYQLRGDEIVDNIETFEHVAGIVNGYNHSVFLPSDIDLFIHAGDSSMHGTEFEIRQFLEWLSGIKAKHKVLIAGNHDFLFERQRMIAKELLEQHKDIIYLESSSIEIEGIKIYGEPRQPWFHSWAFNVQRGPDIRKYWDAIPEDTDILVTHGPPYGILDMTLRGENVGCKDLRDRIQELPKLKMVVFGHIHEDAGHELINGIHYVNASVLNVRYQLQNRPQAFLIDENKNITKIDIMEVEKQEEKTESKFAPIKETVQFDELMKMDIRICKIESVEKVQGKDKLYKLEINTGVDKRVVVSAIAHQISEDKILNKKFPFILNLPPRPIAGIESHGMIILAADSDKNYHLPGDEETEVGSIVI